MCFRIMVLANPTIGIGSSGVEISQGNRTQSICPHVIMQDSIDDHLGSPVDIGRYQSAVLIYRNACRLPIDCSRAGEDDAVDAGCTHGVEQMQCTDHIVRVVGARLNHRLADKTEGCEVDNARHVELPDGHRDVRRVGDVADNKRNVLWNGPAVPFGKVIEHGDLVAVPYEPPYSVRSNVASPTSHENRSTHHPLHLFSTYWVILLV